MIKIETTNETSEGFDLTTRIEGEWFVILNQLVCIFDKIYEASPSIFEDALLHSQYTKDHT